MCWMVFGMVWWCGVLGAVWCRWCDAACGVGLVCDAMRLQAHLAARASLGQQQQVAWVSPHLPPVYQLYVGCHQPTVGLGGKVLLHKADWQGHVDGLASCAGVHAAFQQLDVQQQGACTSSAADRTQALLCAAGSAQQGRSAGTSAGSFKGLSGDTGGREPRLLWCTCWVCMRACQHAIHPSVLALLLQQDAQLQPRHQLVLRQVERPVRTERRKVAGGGVGGVSVEVTAPSIAPRRSDGHLRLGRQPTHGCAGKGGAPGRQELPACCWYFTHSPPTDPTCSTSGGSAAGSQVAAQPTVLAGLCGSRGRGMRA